jgi:hypothetical protein
MSEVYLIDGQALTPSSFGATDKDGNWSPIAYTGTYGQNGFYLNFKDATSTTTIGYDYSGNGNNWTPNNLSVTAGVTYDSMIDVPEDQSDGTANNRGSYCTLNPLSKNSAASTSNANLTGTTTTATEQGIYGTIGVSNGKWYFEAIPTSITSGGCMIGVAPSTTQGSSGAPGLTVTTGYGYYTTGNKYNGAGASYGNSYTTNDIIGVALDLDNGKIYWSKNGTWQASGDPAAGTNAAYTGLSGTFVAGVGNGGETSASTVSFNFGQRPFAYTPPSGFKSLNTFNLPEPTIKQPNKQFDTTLYTGNGSTRTITNSGSMQPDFVWIKNRTSGSFWHQLYDVNRGPLKALFSNQPDAESTYTDTLTAFTSTGFTLGTDATFNGGVNKPSDAYVAWQWRASNAAGVSNTSGSIASTVSVNPTAGFSIVTWTGNVTSGATIGHGLGAVPSMVIVKNRSAGSTNWCVYHVNNGNTKADLLNRADGPFTNTNYWNDTTPTSSVFSLGNSADTNGSGNSMVAYCFAPIAGYSAFGTYTGNGSTDGTFIYTGFRPRYIMLKCSSNATNWWVYDSSRNTYNAVDLGLVPSQTNADTSGYPLDFLSNGFKFRNSNGDFNGSGRTYIYMAFAEMPFKYSRSR